MKKHYIDLNKMGLTPMSEFEMIEVDGGGFWSFLASIGLAALVVGLILITGGAASVAAGLIIGAIGIAVTAGAYAAGIAAGEDMKPFGLDLQEAI